MLTWRAVGVGKMVGKTNGGVDLLESESGEMGREEARFGGVI